MVTNGNWTQQYIIRESAKEMLLVDQMCSDNQNNLRQEGGPVQYFGSERASKSNVVVFCM